MKKNGLRFRRTDLRIWLWLLCMTAGGGVSVLISNIWDRPFYVEVGPGNRPEEEARDVPELVSMLGDGFLEENGDYMGHSEETGSLLADPDGENSGDISSRREEADLSRRLNFAYYYDEGAASQDISQSYAGRAYQMLLKKDSAWMAGLYGLRRVSPEAMAARLGMDKSAVTGVRHLNGVPVDNGEKAQVIPSWNRFNVTFRNGDGAVIMGYSNIKEILSLANVCGYFSGQQSYDFLSSYAGKLWNGSHSSRISVSNVYYCQGKCLYSEDSGSLSAAAQAEAQNAGAGAAANRTESGNSGTESGAGSSADGDSSETRSEDQETQAVVHETADIFMRQNDYEPADETLLKMREAEKAAAETLEASGEASQTDTSDSLNGESAGQGQTGESAQESSSQAPVRETEAPSEGAPENRAEPESTDTANGAAEEHAAAAQADEAKAGTDTAGEGETANRTDTAGEAAAYREAGAGDPLPVPDTPITEVETAASQDGSAAGRSQARTLEGTKSQTESGQYCMGHIDLNITAVVIGIDDRKGLFHCADTPAKTGDGADWNGWDDVSMACARSVAQQDWYAEYGLASPESAYVQNPLSGSEIAEYMKLIGENTSPKRRQVAEQALLSVGCIPYYWGGKPSAGGFEGNGFGTVTAPDEDGRILRGLDCSGWINWVYWTALGSPLPAQSTSGLMTCGRGVEKKDLRTGDILIRTGSQPHVYMFLAWAADGSMYLIHETTGNVSNVTVGTYDLDLPCYRSLINEE